MIDIILRTENFFGKINDFVKGASKSKLFRSQTFSVGYNYSYGTGWLMNGILTKKKRDVIFDLLCDEIDRQLLDKMENKTYLEDHGKSPIFYREPPIIYIDWAYFCHKHEIEL